MFSTISTSSSPVVHSYHHHRNIDRITNNNTNNNRRRRFNEIQCSTSTTSIVDLSDRLKLDNVRQSLIRQEDSIIFALIERSQYKQNVEIYKSSSSLNYCDDDNNNNSNNSQSSSLLMVPSFDAKTGKRHSMLEFMLREREQIDGKIRRYTSPDEHAFFPEALPPLVIPPMNFGKVLHDCSLAININDRVQQMYVENIITGMCESGDDNNYGSAGLCDVNCLQLISRRIHYGKFVAEAKFRANMDEYSDLIRKQDAEGLMRLLTNQAVEDRVVARVTNKAAFYGQDINEDIPDASKVLTNNQNQKYKVAPEIIADLYFKWIMPMTKDVQVSYLLRRLD